MASGGPQAKCGGRVELLSELRLLFLGLLPGNLRKTRFVLSDCRTVRRRSSLPPRNTKPIAMSVNCSWPRGPPLTVGVMTHGFWWTTGKVRWEGRAALRVEVAVSWSFTRKQEEDSLIF